MQLEDYRFFHAFAPLLARCDGHTGAGDEVALLDAERLPPHLAGVARPQEDRNDDVHNEDTYVLMIYRNSHDEENRIYTPVQDFDQFLDKNPMYMFSNEETKRMSDLAIERIPYMIKAFENKENTILIKIGLLADEEHWEDGKPQHEHIWFELKDVKDGSVVAQLTQEPYYVSGIKEGDTGTYPFSDITDWIIFTKECRITPDDAYLLC